jgi:hypothetical protein
MANNNPKSYLRAGSLIRKEDVERALRAEVQKEPLVTSILEISRWLILGYMPRYARPEGLPSDPRAHLLQWEAVNNEDLARLKVVLDTRFRLLGKVLPDLKAVEVTDTTPQQTLTDLELAARVAALVSRNQSPVMRMGGTFPSNRMSQVVDAVLVEPEEAPIPPPDALSDPYPDIPDWL